MVGKAVKKATKKKKAAPKKKEKILYVVSDHYLVPKHSVLTDKEKEVLFKQFDVRFSELPKILLDDPALKGLDVKSGHVIKIEKEHSVIGTLDYYRGVSSE